jgi:uncharacterized protein (TIGR03086 family)
MNQLDAHKRAQDVFADILANVKPDQLDNGSPCETWTAKDIIDHVCGGNQWVVQLVGNEPAALPDDIVAAHRASAEEAQGVFAASDGLSRMFELPFGTMPGAAFIGIRTSDVLTHAWDLAKATSQPTDLDRQLAVEALVVARAKMSPAFRGPGRPFGEEQPCPPGRPPADELAAFLGRAVD